VAFRGQQLIRVHNESLSVAAMRVCIAIFISLNFAQQAGTNRPFQFQKRSQHFIRTHVFAQPKVQPRFLR